MKLFLNIILLAFLTQLIGWSHFDDVTFYWEYREEVGAKVQMPKFNKDLLSLEGKVIELSGYYLPMDMQRKHIIISKQPFASCFFCGGGGGPESVAEVHFKEVPRRFKQDEIVHVRGKLQLNPDDFDHLVFILTDAEIID